MSIYQSVNRNIALVKKTNNFRLDELFMLKDEAKFDERQEETVSRSDLGGDKN